MLTETVNTVKSFKHLAIFSGNFMGDFSGDLCQLSSQWLFIKKFLAKNRCGLCFDCGPTLWVVRFKA